MNKEHGPKITNSIYFFIEIQGDIRKCITFEFKISHDSSYSASPFPQMLKTKREKGQNIPVCM